MNGSDSDAPTVDALRTAASSSDADPRESDPDDDPIPEQSVGSLPTPPGPDGWPLIGNTSQFVSDVWGFYDVLAEYGDVASYRVGGFDFVTLLHPDHVQRVLVDESHRFRKGDVLRASDVEFLERGLLLSEGDRWATQRKTLQPMFFRERIASYGDAMAEEARRLVESWDDGEEVDLQAAYSELTLRVLARTLVGIEPDESLDTVRRAAVAVQERGDAGSIQAFLPEWLPTPASRRYRRAVSDFEDLVERLIERRRREDDGTERDDLLSTLVAAAESGTMSDREIADQLMTFLFAGHETTSLGLTYATYVLATESDVAAELRAELVTVIGDGDALPAGATPTPDDVQSLDYVERVIRETLRLYPPAYVLFRHATEDLAFDGYRVPEGTEISLPTWRIHTDPRFWDAPETVDPSRWLDDDPDRPEYAYFPFGGGPRHCIGMRFAMLELQVVLSSVAAAVEFDLVSDRDLSFDPGATLQPSDPVRVRVRRR